MKKLTFTLFLSTTVLLSTAQPNKDPDRLRRLTKLDVSFQGIGFTVEPKLSKRMTMDISLGAGGGYEVYTANFHYRWDFTDPAFYFSLTPKLYYNRAKRLANGKSIKYNSGNYFGLRLKYTTPSIRGNNDVYDTGLMNIHWGMQRPIGGRWTFNTSFGAGLAVDLTYLSSLSGTFYPAVDVKFSYIFSK